MFAPYFCKKYGSHGCQSDAQVLEQFWAVIQNIFSESIFKF